MNHPIVIAHISISDTEHTHKTVPQSNIATLKAEISKFLNSHREGLSKRLHHRSSLQSLLEEVLNAKFKKNEIENHQPDEFIDASTTNKVTKFHPPFNHSYLAEVWEEDNLISVDVTDIAMLRAIEHSPFNSWESSRLRQFVRSSGSPPENITQSKDWWDRPLWAWKRNELTLANGAMLAVEMIEHLKPVLLPSQKLKVTVSNLKQLLKSSIPGEWSYCIAPFGEADGWYGQEKGRDLQPGSHEDLSVSSACNENSKSTTMEQTERILEKPSERGDQRKWLEITTPLEIPTAPESNDASILKQNAQSESRVGKSAPLAKEDSNGAKGSMPLEIDSNSILLSDCTTSTIAIASIPVTLSPEESIAIEDKISRKHTLESSHKISIDLNARNDQIDLSTNNLAVSESKKSPTISPDTRKPLISTPSKNQCKSDPTASHSSRTKDMSCAKSSSFDKNDCLQEKTITEPTPLDGTKNSRFTSDQLEKLRSIAVSPSSTQEVEEEKNVANNDSSEGSHVLPKSPQFDSQGIDLSMLSQIPQELRSEARLALAVRQPRKTRKRRRPPTNSQLYKWLSSSIASVTPKFPRTENHFQQEKKRPTNIKDFFPAS